MAAHSIGSFQSSDFSFGAEFSSRSRLMTDGSRSVMWFQNRRFQLTRLETRTKEFIRMCEYVTQNGHMRNESER